MGYGPKFDQWYSKSELDNVKELINDYEAKTHRMNEFYHQIFELWKDTETPEDERIEQFKTTLKLAISQPLLGHTFMDMRTFLDAARKIKDKKSIITNNFPKQWQEKSNSSKNLRS